MAAAGHACLLLLVLASPWPFGATPDEFRYLVYAAALVGASLVTAGRGAGRPGDVSVLGLALLPCLQLGLGWTLAPAATLDAALGLGAMASAVLAARIACESTRRRRQLVVAVVVSAVAQAVFGVIQHLVSPAAVYGRRTEWTTTPFGSFVNHNHFASFAGCGALLAFGLAFETWKQRGPAWITALSSAAGGVLVIAVLASGSRGGFLTLIVGFATALALMFRMRARLLVPSLFVLCALLLGLLPDARARIATVLRPDASMGYRADLAHATLRLAAEHPLVGSGLGAFEDVVPPHKHGHGGVQSAHAESDALQFLAEGGAIGVLCLLVVAASLGRPVRVNLADRHRRHLTAGAAAAMAALAANACIDFSWRTPAVALALVCCIAVATASRAGVGEPGLRRPLLPLLPALLAVACLWRGAGAWGELRVRQEPIPMKRVDAAEDLVQLHPTQAQLRVELGRGRVALHRASLRALDLSRAAADYRAALALRPRWALAWYELAWVEWAQGHPTEARAALAEAGRCDPVHWEVGAARVRLLAALDGPAAATVAIEEWQARDPHIPPDRIRALVQQVSALK
jgi:O-antigen ligase